MKTPAAALAFIAACAGAPLAPSPAPAPVVARPAAAPATPADPLAAPALLADVAWLCAPARAGRGSRSAGAQATAAWLAAQLRALGLEVSLADVGGDLAGQANVIAIWRGTAPAPALLLVAHYDHLGRGADGAIYPGADDNASGVAALLAVARDVAARRDVRRPLVFLFPAGEEVELAGSRAYAAAPAWPLADTRAIVNLDMVGRRFFEEAVDRDAAIGVVGLGDDAALAAAVRRAAATAGLALVPASPALLYAVGEAFRADDWSFRGAGRPALHLSTGLHDDYHRPSDTPDKLSPAQLERTARLVRGVVTELERELDPPTAPAP